MKTLTSPIREFFKKGDLILLTLCLITSVFGVALIYSATRWFGGNRNVIVQSGAIVLGVVVYMVITLVDLVSLTEKFWRFFLVFNFAFILLLKTPLGTDRGSGNLNWLAIPGIPVDIQPNELVKIPFILIIAWIVHKFSQRRIRIGSLPSMAVITGYTLVMIGLIVVVCGDYGTCMVYLVIFAVMMWTAGVGLGWFLIPATLGVAGVLALWFFYLPGTRFWTDYRVMRFRVVFDHALDPLGVGWQQTRSVLAIGSGQLTGQGYLQGTQTQAMYSDALPERQTDFIFSVCGEELGLLGCSLLLLLLTLIVLRCIWIGFRASDSFSACSCMGIAGMIAAQIIFNVGMCLYVLPVMGLTLPFVSYGGSSIITLYAAMGIVSSVKAHPMPSWLRDRAEL